MWRRSRVRGSVVGPFSHVAILLSCVVSSEFKHVSHCWLYSDVCTVCRCVKIILCLLFSLFAAVCSGSGQSHGGTAGHPDILVHSAMLHAQGGHRLGRLVRYTNITIIHRFYVFCLFPSLICAHAKSPQSLCLKGIN